MYQAIMERQVLIYLFLLGLFLKSSAQPDSSVISMDTVILLKEPVIVRKEVILGNGAGSSFSKSRRKVISPIQNQKWSLLLGFSTGASELKTPHTPQNLKADNNSQSYLILILHHHNLQFGIGAGFISTSLKYSVYTPGLRCKQEIIKIYDYSHASTILLPGQIIIEGITSRDSVVTTNYTELEENRKKVKLLYLKVPLNFAYRLNLENRKFFILPQLELTPNILITKPDESNIEMPETLFWMYGGRCSLGYDITENLSILASVQLQNSIGGIFKNLETSRSKLTGYGFALSYKLN